MEGLPALKALPAPVNTAALLGNINSEEIHIMKSAGIILAYQSIYIKIELFKLVLFYYHPNTKTLK